MQSIVSLGKGLDLAVVAEGVEDLQTLQFLKTVGCDSAQGYYIAKPMPQAEMTDWMDKFSSADWIESI